jgi:hypothetical protein
MMSIVIRAVRHKAVRGQSGIEVMLAAGVVIATLIGMFFYVQQAYQGYLYTYGSSHGPQYHYQGNYTDRRSLNQFSVKQDIRIEQEDIQEGVRHFGGYCPSDQECLPDTPGGAEADMALSITTANTKADWVISRDATFEAK